jgi:hypothetical protein
MRVIEECPSIEILERVTELILCVYDDLPVPRDRLA